MGCGEGRHTIGAYIEKPVNSFGFDLSYEDLQIAKGRLNDFDVSNLKRAINVNNLICILKLWMSNLEHQDPHKICDIENLSMHGCLFKRHNK